MYVYLLIYITPCSLSTYYKLHSYVVLIVLIISVYSHTGNSFELVEATGVIVVGLFHRRRIEKRALHS